jgi:hypothetical protein
MNPLSQPLPRQTAGKVRAGLVVFGVILIGIGAVKTFLAAGLVVPGSPETVPGDIRQILLQGGGALGAVVVGVGSMFGRRWARSLGVCLGVVGLGAAALALIHAAILVAILKVAPTWTWTAWAVPLAGLVLNAALIGFYALPGVRRACEILDPVERWTDRCPLPVLVGCVWLVFSGFQILAGLHAGSSAPGIRIAPFALAGFGVLTLAASVGIFRMRRLVWGLYLAIFLGFWAAGFWNVIRISRIAAAEAASARQIPISEAAPGGAVPGVSAPDAAHPGPASGPFTVTYDASGRPVVAPASGYRLPQVSPDDREARLRRNIDFVIWNSVPPVVVGLALLLWAGCWFEPPRGLREA